MLAENVPIVGPTMDALPPKGTHQWKSTLIVAAVVQGEPHGRPDDKPLGRAVVNGARYAVSALRASIPLAFDRCAQDWPVPRTCFDERRSTNRACPSRPRSVSPTQPLHTSPDRQHRAGNGSRLRRRRRHYAARGPAPPAPATNKPVAPHCLVTRLVRRVP